MKWVTTTIDRYATALFEVLVDSKGVTVTAFVRGADAGIKLGRAYKCVSRNGASATYRYEPDCDLRRPQLRELGRIAVRRMSK